MALDQCFFLGGLTFSDAAGLSMWGGTTHLTGDGLGVARS